MNRSVRNGIAIAGMAGGMWLLGHAVANADTGQTASADNTTTTTSTTDGSSSSNDSTNVAKATNDNSTTVDTGNIKGGNGGTNTATINTGVSSGGGDSIGPSTSTQSSNGGSSGGSGTSVTASTGNVSVTQQANGGSVSGSGNVKVNNSATQSASASNNVSQSSTSSGSSGHKGDSHDGVSPDSSTFDEGHGHGGGNDSTNIAVAHNDNSTEVDTGNIRGGNGGENFAEANTGLLLEPVYAPVVTFDSSSNHGRHDGDIDVTVATGAVWVRQEANGGDVSGSGNVDVTGNAHQSASASNDVTQTSTSADRRRHHHDGDWWWFGDKGGNDSANIAVAHNDNSTYVDTGNISGGGGGLNAVEANTGVIIGFFPVIRGDSTFSTFGMKDGEEYDHHHHSSSIDVTVSTGDISATQEANGGDVSKSGNVSVCTSADQSASASNDVTQNSSSEGGKGRSGNDAFNKAIAHNDNSVEVYTGNIRGGRGGENIADLNTGAIIEPFFLSEGFSTFGENDGEYHHHHRSIDVTVSTGDVSATQEANGGDVSGSGNVSVNNSATQTASASNDVTQNSSNKGDDHRWWFESRSGNHSANIAVSRNENDTYVETGNITGGNGGGNEADVNTGLIGPAFLGHLPNSLSVSTGDVQVSQEANGGDVTKSGNVSVGNKEQCGCEQAATPTPPTTPSTPKAPSTPTAPVVKTVTTTVKVLSGAQPTSTLAVTGADTSAPLTAGLLALGAGAALTMAGRRRREAQNG